MKVLICGSRDWTDTMAIAKIIGALKPETKVIVGGARGADTIAQQLAEVRTDLPEPEVFNADWNRYGKRAGILRNIEMLDQEPDEVYAFPLTNHSIGTFHTIKEAERRGIKTTVISGWK